MKARGTSNRRPAIQIGRHSLLGYQNTRIRDTRNSILSFQRYLVFRKRWAVSRLKDSIHFRGLLNFGNLPNAPADWCGGVSSRQVRKLFKQFEEGQATLPGIAPHMTCDARAPSVAVLRVGSLNSWSRVGSNYGKITRHQSGLGPFTQGIALDGITCYLYQLQASTSIRGWIRTHLYEKVEQTLFDFDSRFSSRLEIARRTADDVVWLPPEPSVVRRQACCSPLVVSLRAT